MNNNKTVETSLFFFWLNEKVVVEVRKVLFKVLPQGDLPSTLITHLIISLIIAIHEIHDPIPLILDSFLVFLFTSFTFTFFLHLLLVHTTDPQMSQGCCSSLPPSRS